MDRLHRRPAGSPRPQTLARLFAAGVCVLLLSCAPAEPGGSLGPGTSRVRALVERLNARGALVQAVAPSKYASWFGSAPAAWIKTSRGTLDVVFPGSGRKGRGIRWAARPDARRGRYRYVVRVGRRSRTIDANRPLHILNGRGMLVITDSRPLAAIVRRLIRP